MILSRPNPDYTTLLSGKYVIPKAYKDLHFYSSGRYALLAGLNFLGVSPGSIILLPAYICDSVVIALKMSGYTPIFFDIKPNLEIDNAKVISLIDEHNAKSVLVVHYFGFPNKIKELSDICRMRNVKLIEDCCHGFLTSVDGMPIGVTGDAAIYSFRKTFPVSDGGALKLNCLEKQYLAPKKLSAKRLLNVYLFSRLVERVVASSGLINLYSPFIDSVKKQIVSKNKKKQIQALSEFKEVTPSFQLNQYLGNEEYIRQLSSVVSRNYEMLVQLASEKGWKAFVPELMSNCVPQWAPFFDSTTNLVKWLRRNGVGASRWPWHELPSEVKGAKEKYPVSCELDKKLALLPIHQSLAISDIKKISGLMENYKKIF